MVINSFWQGLLTLGALTAEPTQRYFGKETQVLVIGDSLMLQTIGQKILANRPDVFLSILKETPEPIFWPFAFRGAGTRLLSPWAERRRRRAHLRNLEITLLGSLPAKAITEVWCSYSEWQLYLYALFPRAQFVSVDHGVSDTTARAQQSIIGWRTHVHRTLEKLERNLLAVPATRYSHNDLIVSPNFRISDFDIDHVAITSCLTNISEGINGDGWTRGTVTERPWTLVMPPPLPPSVGEAHANQFAELIIGRLKDLDLGSIDIVVKSHPTNVTLSDPKNLSLLEVALSKYAQASGGQVVAAPATIPVEALFGRGPKLLIGLYSTAFLSARLWFPEIALTAVDWTQPLLELTHMRWSSEDLAVVNNVVSEGHHTYNFGRMTRDQFAERLTLQYESSVLERTRFEILAQIDSGWTWPEIN